MIESFVEEGRQMLPMLEVSSLGKSYLRNLANPCYNLSERNQI